MMSMLEEPQIMLYTVDAHNYLYTVDELMKSYNFSLNFKLTNAIDALNFGSILYKVFPANDKPNNFTFFHCFHLYVWLMILLFIIIIALILSSKKSLRENCFAITFI